MGSAVFLKLYLRVTNTKGGIVLFIAAAHGRSGGPSEWRASGTEP